MGQTMNPKSPLRADYRLLRYLTGSVLGGKVEPRPEEFDRVIRVFKKAGGSWVRLFQGSPKDLGLLKAILKAAEKLGYMTKTPKWNGEKDDKNESEGAAV